METLLYKPPQVAEILNLGRSKTYELIATGQIKSIRIGRAIRIPAKALREYVEYQEQEAQAQAKVS
jgi:excisionase family DNA binding protein